MDTEVEGRGSVNQQRQLNVSLLPRSAFGKGAAAVSYLLQAQGIRGGRQEGF